MTLQHTIESVFAELEEAIDRMTDQEYVTKSSHLFGATIGQHVRHIIELFQCLVEGYDTGVVNYDKRKRDYTIETDRRVAICFLHEIPLSIGIENRRILLQSSFGSDTESLDVESNFLRELVYNLEHTIHHMALIRVGIAELTKITVSEKFGVAPSTIQFRKTCVQ
ncbi:hypothetical protein CJD36_014290 [Flavipsychrobacter stenotrophus]|uniref:DinB family protein n=1 Tax=Flavipsychrobacter stenotrophus TaxID=2077091 RepID=A0A2S7SWM0_9BACT|nr:hypothetical protein [Flavipsychrobacter stenotrophus]PQJ11134.1 hypothetical protein CJD36_014290 [Flavipsychrobacter stenotrophus]